MEEYLRPTQIIDSDSAAIREKAQDLTAGRESDRERAVALYYFVRDQITHNPYAPGWAREQYTASTTLARGDGFCVQKAILLAALARASGIPARIGFADVRDHRLSPKFRDMIGGGNLLIWHGYAELHIGGVWVHASPAYDLEVCRRRGFVPVEFDGVNDARDPPFDLAGRPHIEYVTDHGQYADLPWEAIVDYREAYVAQIGLDWQEHMARWRDSSGQ
jgi:transglutaminase-like putative cysteine protease